MNERIKEIWDKAAESTLDQSWESQTKFMERFAELIIQECATIANAHMVECESINYGIGTRIKRDFGVE